MPLPPPPAWPPDDPEIRESVRAALDDGSWGRYDGPNGERLAAELARRFAVPHVYLCGSGTFAVELALRALRVTEGEVVLAGYDYPGNFRAIEAVGARPVLVDLGAGWTPDAASIEPALGPDTRAIVVSHLHGCLAPMPGICQLAAARGVPVVEDTCQAPGARVGGRPAGAWGDVATLSFGGSKLLTAGRGGAVLLSRPEQLQRVKVHCERGNQAYPLSELQAAALLPQLDALERRHARRLRAVRRLLARLPREFVESCSAAGLAAEDAGAPDMPDSPDMLDALDSPAFYKLAWLVGGESAGDEERQQRIGRLRAAGAPVGEGFRGFLRRTSGRCRQATTLGRCRAAAERTLLLDQSALLGDDAYLDALAALLAATLGA